jgi:polyisoprenyl-phosphate glycosyltransferase
MNSDKQLISIIIPLLDEIKIFPTLLCRLDQLYNRLINNYELEVLLIDDGSSDGTWQAIKEAVLERPYIVGFSFSRNFGHQSALTCGHENARGDAIITMDGDLQDPPELIEQMIVEWQKGADIVLLKRTERGGENIFKRFTAYLFYRIISFLSPIKIPVDVGDFRLLSRKANNILNNMHEHSRYLRGMVSWIGFSPIIIPYKRQIRNKGKTKFSFLRMMAFSLDGIISMSSRPLKLSYLFAIIASIPFLLYLAGNFIAWLWFDVQLVRGWASLQFSIVIFGSLILIMLGVIGEYLGRIYENIKQRPHYIVREIINKRPLVNENKTD